MTRLMHPSLTTHFIVRLAQRYDIVGNYAAAETWCADIASGRAELVWVFPHLGSRTYRLLDRRTGTRFFAVVSADGVFITAPEPCSFERTDAGWYQLHPMERLARQQGAVA